MILLVLRDEGLSSRPAMRDAIDQNIWPCNQQNMLNPLLIDPFPGDQQPKDAINKRYLCMVREDRLGGLWGICKGTPFSRPAGM